MNPYPVPGRCGACLHRCEQYPSGRWRHLVRPCPPRSASLFSVGDLPAPRAVFVPDTEPLPQPDERGHWRLIWNGPDEFPTQMGWHSERQVAAWWRDVREHLHYEMSGAAS